jgi:hypothetical protein
MPAFVGMGVLTAATSIMQGIGGAGQNKAQAIAARMQQDQQNFNNRWQNEAQNRNILRAWEAQYHVNKGLERAADQTRATQEYYAKEAWKNTASQLSKQTRQANSAYLGSVSSRGMSLDSASARALLRQASSDAQTNSANLRTNYANQMRDIETQYQNMLNQRNRNAPEQVAFMETRGGTVDSSSSIMMTSVATGLLGGVGSGLTAANTWK